MVRDFWTTKLNVPVAAATILVEWRAPGGALLETDTLVNGGVVPHPDGKTGHYRATWTVPGDAEVSAGYSAQVSWTDDLDNAYGPEASGFEVTLTTLDVSFEQPWLATPTEIRDMLVKNTVNGALPSGLTDAILEAWIVDAHGTVLTKFNAEHVTELVPNHLSVARAACRRFVAADLLLALQPNSEHVTRIASYYRESALEDIHEALNPKPAKATRYTGVDVV